MRRKFLYAIGLAILVVAFGIWLWPGQQFPDDPDELILFSVNGKVLGEEPEERVISKNTELLYECPVLGKVQITDAALKREIISAVKEDIRVGNSRQSKCFYPRHILRVVKDGQIVDVAICFECHNYKLHRNGAPFVGYTPSIGESSKPLLNKILTDAGVPIAP